MSSTICGRCAATAVHLTPRRNRLVADDALILTRRALAWNSNYRLYASAISSPIQINNRRHTSSSSSASSEILAKNVNPPLSTLPAELNTSSSSTGKVSRLIAIGRAYLSFYKTGLRNVYSNYKASLPIRRALGLPTYIPSSPPPPVRHSSSASGAATSFDLAIETLDLTRSDFQLVRRSAYDVRRMIPFSLILMICGEFTPMIVLAVGDAVTPYTCRVPKQLQKTRLQRLQRKQSALAAVQGGLGSVTRIPTGSQEEMTWLAEQFGSKEFASTASAEQVLRACAVFGLTKSHDRASLLVPLIYRPRLERWVEYLLVDDRLIVKGGGVDALSAQEVQIALEERGGVGVDDESAQREWLNNWLKRRHVL